ncbi:hypothetical protein BGZ96_010387 [Linnemannia gamsii]|uniref:Uncharacterized protein n=1 Tax=Linnemannia gamsii TaxID=64522 RepID=A0ABQ7JUT0_9FUNG|nr:hypothetical protein BGZ96_010387 [Linnemannia gamsii]
MLVPKEHQDNKHMRLYHDPEPVKILNTVAGGADITINRDPNKGMYYPCAHPACDHISIVRTAPSQHRKFCRFTNPLENRPRRTRAVRERRYHPYSRVQKEGRSDSTFSDFSDDGLYSSFSSSGLESGRQSDRESGYHIPWESTSALILEQILEGVNRLNSRMDWLTEQMEEIQEQTDRNVEQVDKLVVNSASLDAHTESLRIDVDLIVEYLGDLLQENRGIKNQLRGIKMGLEEGVAAGDPRRQVMIPPKEQQQKHAAAHGQATKPIKE